MNSQASALSEQSSDPEIIGRWGCGVWLRAAREKRKLTIKQLAMMSGVSASQIYSIQRDETCNLSEPTRKGLADALGETVPAVPKEAVQTLSSSEYGGWLSRSRQKSGLSARQLADKAGVSVGQISRIERGSTRKPHARTARKLWAALREALRTKQVEKVVFT